MQPGETVLVWRRLEVLAPPRFKWRKLMDVPSSPPQVEARKLMFVGHGADVVVDYNSEDLYEKVMEAILVQVVTSVYDPVGGEYFDT